MPVGDKVRHVGDSVAVVVAESAYIAEDAIELIDVTYAPLPVVMDAKKAMQPGMPLVHDDVPEQCLLHLGAGRQGQC